MLASVYKQCNLVINVYMALDKQINYKFATLAVHAGHSEDPFTGAVIPPISLSTTFKQSEVGVHKGYEYSRSGNPTRDQFENAIAVLEKGRFALAFSSGSAATASIINMLDINSHLISVNDVYGGTYRYFTKVANTKGVHVDFVELEDPNNIVPYIKDNTKLIWIETPTNPTLRIVDIQKICEIAHQTNILVVVDNTFLSPYFSNPLELGADMVAHSVTKYINGHSDVVMGVVAMKDEDLYNRLKFQQNSFGAVPSPFDCFLAHRGLKTLKVRMDKHEQNGVEVANYLESLIPQYVNKVNYPGLKSHKQYDLVKRQQKGFGGMLSFDLNTTKEKASEFVRHLKIITLAESLGGIESLIEIPSLMTHGSVDYEERMKLGITDTLVRMSCGIEDGEDLIEDLKGGFKAIFSNFDK